MVLCQYKKLKKPEVTREGSRASDSVVFLHARKFFVCDKEREGPKKWKRGKEKVKAHPDFKKGKLVVNLKGRFSVIVPI